MKRLTRDAVGTKLLQLPPMPAVVDALIQSLDEEGADLRKLGEAVGSDPILAAKVLRVANSSFYGLTRQVATIQDATIVLGFRTIRTLVLMAGLTGQFSKDRNTGFNLRGCLLHGMSTAICARVLGRHAGLSPDMAFAAGLLHDIGRVGLASCFPEHYGKVIAARQERDCPYIEAEHEVLGFDHAQAGQIIAQHWKFPRLVQRAVAEHHAAQGDGPLTLAGLLHIADVVAHALDVAEEEQELVPQLSHNAWAGLHMSWPEFQVRLPEIERETRAAAALLA